MEDGQGALVQLRAYLAQHDLPPESRLPPERELGDMLGVSRGELRKALAVLEEEGLLWRHVGKGTFIGARPVEAQSAVAEIAERTSPAEVMRARLIVEPEIAREAALNAHLADVEVLTQCLDGARRARTWREYENWDNRLHRAVAEAAHNTMLLALFDMLNNVRRAVVWGRLRPGAVHPPTDHHSFTEHEVIVAAIRERDRDGAARAMRHHLESVERNLLAIRSAAE